MSDQWPPGPPNPGPQNYGGHSNGGQSYGGQSDGGGGGYPPQRPPHYPHGGYPQPPKSNGKWYAMVGGLLVVIAGLIAVATGAVAVGGADALEVTEAPEPPPVFEPAANEGADPFFPLDAQLAGFEQEVGRAPSQQDVATGLYGGTAQNTCDPQRLIDYLMANPAKGRAWAQVQDIAFEEIPNYINSLSVRVLSAPTTVLNHGFDAGSGAPYEILTTLDAGTAVLVDAKGDVRARCYCGNPIKPKPIGHKPPRCIQVPTMVYTEPAGSVRRDGVPAEVLLTGRVTTDMAWHEISWGPTEMETGWTPATNLHRYLCLITLPPPIGITPTPFPTTWPTPTPTWTPGPTPTPTPTPRVWPTPTPTPPPHPTPTPPPHPTPTPPPHPTPTPHPQPLQIRCFITDTDLLVGETTEFSAFHVPDSVGVTYAFDHGDGTIDRRNPSIAFYNHPGSYEVYAIATVGGEDRRQHCGTVMVKEAARIRLGCSISNIRASVGDTITISARAIPEDPSVRFVIDHGDGYQDEASTSYAVYRSPGSYDVRVTAFQGSSTTPDGELFCGTITVEGERVCSTDGYHGMTRQEAADLAVSRNCSWRIVGEPGDTQYRTDRVNFTMNSHGRVSNVTLG